VKGDPVAILRQELAAARRRGKPFTTAWPEALDTALAAAQDERERRAWEEALIDTLPSWRRAYTDQPASPGERRISGLREMAAA
jgi:hypothetical protein